MKKALKILSHWKAILLFPLLFFFSLTDIGSKLFSVILALLHYNACFHMSNTGATVALDGSYSYDSTGQH